MPNNFINIKLQFKYQLIPAKKGNSKQCLGWRQGYNFLGLIRFNVAQWFQKIFKHFFFFIKISLILIASSKFGKNLNVSTKLVTYAILSLTLTTI
jgi:hypothetical protein